MSQFKRLMTLTIAVLALSTFSASNASAAKVGWPDTPPPVSAPGHH